MNHTNDFSQEDQYIIDESPEINNASEEKWVEKLFSAFPAFSSRNYRLFFSGQLISLIGTWLQMIGEGWLVLELTHSAFWVGLVTAVGSLPVLFFTLFGGVIVDRINTKKLLIFTQVASMILALILGLLTQFKLINVYEVAFLAFLLGTITALDLPARQAFLAEIVNKEQLSSAIALNSGVFNAARVVGPAVAGLLIAIVGIGGVFILNGISYIASIFVLFLMIVPSVTHDIHGNPLTAIAQGIRYCASHESIRILLIFSGLLAIFGWSYATILPVIVQQVFHKDAATLGYFSAASGLGALIGALAVSLLSGKIKSSAFIIGGNLIFCISIFIFSFLSDVAPAMLLLFFAGFGIVMLFSVINTTLQHMVSDKLRGRVMSIYTLMFLGMSPLGSLQIGFLAEHIGPSLATRTGVFLMLLSTIYLYKKRHLLEYIPEK